MLRHAWVMVLRSLLGMGLLALAGCTVVKSWFPDKHKEYQYVSEIPALEIPPDLTSSTIDGATGGSRESWQSAATEERPASASLREATPPPGTEMTPERAKELEAARNHPKPVLAENLQDIPVIEVQATYDIAWAEIAKGLGRMRIEVIDQNKPDGMIVVHYRKEDHQYEDRGLIGDLQDMWSGGTPKTYEYRIKVEPYKGATSIFVLDSEGATIKGGEGFELLKDLNQALQSTALNPKSEQPTK
ncbi:MAG TPA: hypothetical protein DCY52_04140 [Methylococcaceae bacterium]|jgi:outer membrane protein assembly factor BamC|nr:hypothetical protein [Methylococcaceae bacterium]